MLNKKDRKSNWSIFRIALMTLAMLLVMLLAFGYHIGSKHFVVNQHTFYFYDLPAEFDGYKIVQFTDMHIKTFEKGHKADIDTIINIVNRQDADAIVFTGDLVCQRSAELDAYDSIMHSLKAKDGIFSIMGNHDYGTYYKFPDDSVRLADVQRLQLKQKDYGWYLLLNEHVQIERGNSRIAIVGSENQGRPPFPAYGDLDKAMDGLTEHDFCILLTHNPTHWMDDVVAQRPVQLTLSGHTHGGQLKLFGWSPAAIRYKEWSGLYQDGEQLLYVSDGVGCSIFPFRFGAWPEINVITLKKLIPDNK